MRYIKLNTDIYILRTDPRFKDLEIQRPKAAKGAKTRPSFQDIILPEVLPASDCLTTCTVRQERE
jgi:hypothetical protein